MTGSAWVAGATGYTGQQVVGELRRRGVQVVAHVRPDSPRLGEWRQRFQAQGAEVDSAAWEPGALRASLQSHRPALVFALLGTTRARARSSASRDSIDGSYLHVDYGLTSMLLQAARAASPEARFLYLSALGARPNPDDPGESYMGARGRMEAELAVSGQPYSVARPAFVSGPDREESRPLERIAARVSDSLLQAAGALGARTLRDRLHSLTGTELARGLVALALDSAAQGICAGPQELRRHSV